MKLLNAIETLGEVINYRQEFIIYRERRVYYFHIPLYGRPFMNTSSTSKKIVSVSLTVAARLSNTPTLLSA